MSDTFKAFVIDHKDGQVEGEVKTLSLSDLPKGEVTVRIAYSAINYKDGMICNGLGKLVRDYPHIPGIDFAGEVVKSDSADYRPGDQVILTGWRVGEIHWGGLSQYARVQADWLVPLPEGLSMQRAMALGTAGLTAMLSVMTLEDAGLRRDSAGEVLVTGAAGGVGSVAVAVLAKLGYRVAASSGRPEQHDYLRSLGANTLIERAELETPPRGPLAKERWSGAIDTVGGSTLSHVLASLCYWSCCASVGLAASPQFTSTVLPFVIRGVRLQGIDSATCPKDQRIAAWRRLLKEMPMGLLDQMTQTVGLADVKETADAILKGRVRGRTVVDVNA